MTVRTHHCDENSDQLDKPYGRGGIDESQIDENITGVEYYQGSEKSEPEPVSVKVDCKTKRRVLVNQCFPNSKQ